MNTLDIIIRIYNGEKYLDQCLNSIPVHSGIRIVIVDDGSTDNTLKMLESIGDSRRINEQEFLIIQHKDNQGASAAQNSGLNEISSDFVLFLDVDDRVNEEVLLDFLEVQISHDIICFNTWASIDGEVEKNYFPDMFNSFNPMKKNLLTYLFTTPPTLQSKIFRSNLIKKVGAFKDYLKEAGEDKDFLLRCLFFEPSIKFSSDVLHTVLLNREGSLTSNFGKNQAYFINQIYNYTNLKNLLMLRYHKGILSEQQFQSEREWLNRLLLKRTIQLIEFNKSIVPLKNFDLQLDFGSTILIKLASSELIGNWLRKRILSVILKMNRI